MDKSYWTCRTDDPRIDVYLATSINVEATKKYSRPEVQDAHMRAAREALHYYAGSRCLELTGPLCRVDALPPDSGEVGCLVTVPEPTQPISLSVTVYEASC